MDSIRHNLHAARNGYNSAIASETESCNCLFMTGALMQAVQPIIQVVVTFDKSQILSNVFATGLSTIVGAWFLYRIFLVPRLVVSAHQNNSDRKINIFIKNNKRFVSFHADEAYCHIFIPHTAFKTARAQSYLVHDYKTSPKMEETFYQDQPHLHVSSMQQSPMFPQSKTGWVEMENNFKQGEHTISYYFSTRYGFVPPDALKRIEAGTLPTFVLKIMDR